MALLGGRTLRNYYSRSRQRETAATASMYPDGKYRSAVSARDLAKRFFTGRQRNRCWCWGQTPAARTTLGASSRGKNCNQDRIHRTVQETSWPPYPADYILAEARSCRRKWVTAPLERNHWARDSIDEIDNRGQWR